MRRSWTRVRITLVAALGGGLLAGLLTGGTAQSAPGAMPMASPTESAVTISAASQLPVVHRVQTRDPVVFITVDDGIVRSRAARDYILRERIPVTSFLTASVTTGHEAYFRRISRFGSVENHTVSHANFAAAGTNHRAQICPVQRQYRRTYGTRPTLLRPPYGAGARLSAVHSVAADCGITHIVLWDALVDGGRLESWYGGRLQRGSIILLHYGPGLLRDLQVAVTAAAAQGLTPANLRDYLD